MLKDRYLWIAFLLTFLVSLLFLGEVWRSPDSYLFSNNGDGLQTYYQSQFHTTHDSAFFHQQGLNYPYGESIFFTGGQPLVSNLVIVIKPMVDLSEHMIGVTNVMMLLGILICPIFLFLILKQFKMPGLYAALFAVGLTFLSQQWERFGGHYPLAYLYAIPGMIYFQLRYYLTGSWKWSLITFFYMLFLVFAHIYYLVFFAAIAAGFWLALIAFNRERKWSILKSLVHGSVQLILPFLILQLFIKLSSNVVDRTSIPWGFMEYRSSWGSYLFPYGMWYENLVAFFRPKNGVSWEGLGYLGGAAIIMFVIIVIYMVIRFRKFFVLNLKWENRMFLGLALAAVFCIAASFAFPFNYGLDALLCKLGAVQQFRGIGRFAFVGFYVINVLLIALFFRIPFRQLWVKNILCISLVLLLFSEGYTRIKNQSERIGNPRGDLLRLAPNEVTKKLQPELYAAILPLPFFHIGSENIGADCDASFKNYIYDLSLKTGLPTFAASMSRTSLSETFNNIALAKEMMEVPGVLKDVKSDANILLVIDNSVKLDPHLNRYIEGRTALFTDGSYVYYSILPSDIAAIVAVNQLISSEDAAACIYRLNETTTVSDSTAKVISMEDLGSFTFGGSWHRLYDGDISDDWRGDTISVSFWVENFTRDLIPRTSLEIVQKKGDQTVNYFVEYIGKRFVGLKDGNGLIECLIPVDAEAESMTIAVENKLIQKSSFRPYDLIIRPEGVSCSILRHEKMSINNRNFN